jgi:spore maturation protein SpmA
VWAIILLVLAVLGMVSTCVSIFTQGNVRENVSSLLSTAVTAVDVMVLLDFVKYAKAVAKGN